MAKRVQTVDELPVTPDSRPGPYRHLADGELAGALAKCLGRLTAKARTAVCLRFQQEMTYPEMRAICGEREPTLHARVARALPLLRECMERSGYRL